MTRKRVAYCIALFPSTVGRTSRSRIWNHQMEAILFDFHSTIVRLAKPFLINDYSCQFTGNNFDTDRHGGLDSIEASKFFRLAVSNASLEKMCETDENRSRLLLNIISFMFSEYDEITINLNIQHFVDLFSCIISILDKCKAPLQILDDLIFDLTEFLSEVFIPQIGQLITPFASILVDFAIRSLHLRSNRSKIASCSFSLLGSLAKFIGPASMSAFHRISSKALELTEKIVNEQLETPSKPDQVKPPMKRKAILMEELSAEQKPIQHHPDMIILSNSLRSCLAMWKCILQTGGPSIKPNMFRQLQHLICRQLLRFQNGQRKRDDWIIQDPKNRREFYQVLIALVSTAHPFRPSVIQCALPVFQRGFQRDTDLNVVETCRSGLALCAMVAKPQAPAMETVLDWEDKEESERVIGNGSNMENGHNSIANIDSTRIEEQSSILDEPEGLSIAESASAPDSNTVQTEPSPVSRVEPCDQPDQPQQQTMVNLESASEDTSTAAKPMETVTIDTDSEPENDQGESEIVKVSTPGPAEPAEHQVEVNELLAGFVDAPVDDDIVID